MQSQIVTYVAIALAVVLIAVIAFVRFVLGRQAAQRSRDEATRRRNVEAKRKNRAKRYG